MILGCMSGDSAGSSDSAPNTDSPEILQAQAELARHHVDQAQAIYNQIVAEDPNPPGQAYAGKAITDLLLLPGASAVSTLLTEQLDATHPVDANALIYADEGLLYWVVRGVPWEDEGSYKGVKSLISAQIPWSRERISGTRAFFEGITHPLNDATADLVALADSLAPIQADLGRALDDNQFESIYIPGLTFHSEQLDLFLGRSELYLLSAGVSGLRAGLYFMSAYTYDFNLDEALGSQAAQRQDPQPDWRLEDYAYAFLDARVLREVAAPERLLQARESAAQGLDSAIAAIAEGLENYQQTSIRWEQGDAAHAETFIELLGALRQSLFEPTLIPGSSPETTLDLSSFFEGGRTLDASIDWFERVVHPDIYITIETEDGGSIEVNAANWEITDDAAQTFFIDGIFDPPFESDADPPEVTALGDANAEFFETIFGSIYDRVEEVY